MVILLLGGAVGLALAALGALNTGATAGWLGLLAWIAPGVVALVLDGRGLNGLGLRRVGLGAVLGGLLPVVLITVATAASCALGWAAWDPAGEGLRAWWAESQAGRAALDVSDLRTLALGQTGLVLTAPIYGLPLGLGAGLWALAIPSRLRVVGVAVWVGAVAGLGAVPLGPEAPVAVVVAAGMASGGLAAALGRISPWATVFALAGMHGLAGLGPLLAAGPTWAVGWTSWPAITLAVFATVMVTVRSGR